jgi:hypothetical protein
LNWQFGWISAVQNPVNVGNSTNKYLLEVDTVRYQAACFDEATKRINCGKTALSDQSCEMSPLNPSKSGAGKQARCLNRTSPMELISSSVVSFEVGQANLSGVQKPGQRTKSDIGWII